jgi:hypothetical protein
VLSIQGGYHDCGEHGGTDQMAMDKTSFNRSTTPQIYGRRIVNLNRRVALNHTISDFPV